MRADFLFLVLGSDSLWFKLLCSGLTQMDFGSHWLRPSSLLKVSRLRVKVCIESVGICKGLAGRGA